MSQLAIVETAKAENREMTLRFKEDSSDPWHAVTYHRMVHPNSVDLMCQSLLHIMYLTSYYFEEFGMREYIGDIGMDLLPCFVTMMFLELVRRFIILLCYRAFIHLKRVILCRCRQPLDQGNTASQARFVRDVMCQAPCTYRATREGPPSSWGTGEFKWLGLHQDAVWASPTYCDLTKND